jgi:DNA replication and repair protein RecF
LLVTLEAESFRNLAPLAWRPGPGRHLLLGGNGAGKTSVLEAVYAVATTRSFRTPRLGECIRHGAAGFRLAAEVEGRARSALALAYGVDSAAGPGGAGEGLTRTVNGHRVPLSEHLAAQPVVAWTAADAEVVSGPPVRRRRFLDRGVVSVKPAALDALRRYREALDEKRNLLARRPPGAAADPRSLEAWNRVLAAAAVEVTRLRAAYAGELARELGAVLAETGLPTPRVALAYRPSPAAALEGVEPLVERLARAAPAEGRRGMPLVGPHRDELEIHWGDHPAAQVASAGERKLLSLALAAAHGRVLVRAEREPIHLLDDLDAELAADTLAAVWRVFAGAGQLVATSNRPGVWETLPVDRRWQIMDGRIETA